MKILGTHLMDNDTLIKRMYKQYLRYKHAVCGGGCLRSVPANCSAKMGGIEGKSKSDSSQWSRINPSLGIAGPSPEMVGSVE